MKFKKITTDNLFRQPTYNDYKNQKDVLSINTGKDVHPLDSDRNKKIIKKGRKDYEF